MKKEYDFIFLTNTPSFYKINLCNQIAKTNSLLLVLYGYGEEAVNTPLKSSDNYLFDYTFLHEGASEQRNKLKTFIALMKLMSEVKHQKVLFSGWFVPEYNLYAFLSPKRKNCIICESSAKESYFKGIKGWLKKRIINRMSIALPSGELQQEIFDNIHYKGRVSKTGGVGIFNKQPYQKIEKKNTSSKKYLYIGRLIDCKNLPFLIEEFNRSGKSLTIVGDGVLREQLRAMAKPNICFTGFIANEKLKEVYLQHDVFILPSKTEPWGLVVDEALYFGLPVIVSSQVGSSKDLVTNLKTGIVFTYDSSESFQEAIQEMETNYQTYYQRVKSLNFDERDYKQIKAYTSLIG